MSKMEDYNKKQRREIYELGKPLLGQIVSCVGAVAMLVVARKGWIKGDDELFFAGWIPSWLFMYSSYLYHKKFKDIFNEQESRNKSSKLEQDLEN